MAAQRLGRDGGGDERVTDLLGGLIILALAALYDFACHRRR